MNLSLQTKLAVYNTGWRLTLAGAAWALWPWLAGRAGGAWLAGGGLLAGAALLDLVYVRFLLGPLRVLTEQKLRTIHDPDQFDFSSLTTTTTDLIQLDAQINALMGRIKERFACEKAFTAYASHELLTPIAVLRSRFDNLIADAGTPGPVAVRLVESQQTLGRLNKIVQMLLLLARVENHQYLKNDRVSVRAIVKDVLRELNDRIEFKSIRLELMFEPDIVLTRANQSLLYTMLMNLIGNAVRHNAEQGRLSIGRGQADRADTLTITDTGPGLSDEQVATLTHYGRPGSADTVANGIGLPLIHAIARFHHIGLSVDTHPNRGTRITLKFVDNQ